MKMTLRNLIMYVAFVSFAANAIADDNPTISPTAVIITENGEETTNDYAGSAPLTVRFKANSDNTTGWNAYYEWRFTTEGEDEPYLIRYEEETEYTFLKAGSHRIVCYAVFTRGEDSITYTKEYWDVTDPIRISISESKLEFPNAFSPNGDGINDIYKAKSGYQSITEFHAYIFNRWGQKLYEWDNPAEGWDGKYKGKDVKQGVYYVLVKAKGADGRTFDIKRDVNLLRGYTEANGISDFE